MIAQPDIASIPKVANKAQIVKARQNKRENYISGIDSTGDDLFLKINVLPDNKCKGGFTRGEHLCFAEMSKDEEESACSLMPGSPIVSYIGQSWTLLGLASFSKRCKGQQKKALNIVSYRRWINKIISTLVYASVFIFLFILVESQD
ncbi:uncharacterized protein LOC123523471 [Mercenaria mercenaria]|uniref:uncharacterized protein LOC123523471 n=1 Tax=Mercenaria mercenaria TaxID=6596 RepID=UPI00234F3FF9|nr:uncharacterized protein LOC123523471 [Mercenaria mercenaria]